MSAAHGKIAATVLMTVCSLNGLPAENAGRPNQADSRAGEEKFISPSEAEARRLVAFKQRQIEALEVRLAEANETNRKLAADKAAREERDAALGIEALLGDEKSLQNKLLKAVRGVALLEEKNQKLLQICEQFIHFIAYVTVQLEDAGLPRTPYDEFAAEMQKKIAAVGERERKADSDWLNGKVLEVNTATHLIIVDVGWKQGIKPGMTLEISRQGALVAEAKAVDVRDRVTGAFLSSEVAKDQVRTGDRAKIKTAK